MTNDDSVLREVDQAIAEERQWALYRKNAPLLISIGAAAIVGVAGWQFWNARQAERAAAAALEISTAAETLARYPQ
ncbi:MAG: hypothetical protein AB7P23_12190, partial [Amphiplicatus sp.]